MLGTLGPALTRTTGVGPLMTQADCVFTPPLNTSAITPIASLDWLDIAEDAKPADIFRAIGKLRKEAREEIDRLIRFLDDTENHMELEPEDEADDSDLEPSLGSFDRKTNQEKAWRTQSLYPCPTVDCEQDDCDREDADPDECKLQPAEMQ